MEFSDYLYHFTTFIVGDGGDDTGGGSEIAIPDIFGYFITPFTDLIIQVGSIER